MIIQALTVMSVLWAMAFSVAYFCATEVDEIHEFNFPMLKRAVLGSIGFSILLFLLVIAPIGPPMVGYWKGSWKLKWANRILAGLHAVVSSVWSLVAIWILCSNINEINQFQFFLPVPYNMSRELQGQWVSGVAEFTLAFSIYDILYMLLFEPDLAFLLHHLAILSCFAPLFIMEQGTVITTVGIAVAELANPLLGCWTWSKENLKLNKALTPEHIAWHRAQFDSFSFPVTVAYTVTRGVAMPLSLIDTAYYLFYQGKATPMLAWIWVHCVFGFLGSVLWIHMLISGYMKFSARKAAEAAKQKKS
mmetsp:Transcript_11240/g.14528  ORF Transcript_11240/g.14528 Transcript_11240/m.14528 type:complete len:305 (-) Transcript_11240:103-1017(-)